MIRLMVFSDRPEAVLIVADADTRGPIRLPRISAPFVKGDIAAALSAEKIEGRVIESVAGRWTTAINQARSSERAERGQAERMRQANEAAVLRGPNDIDRSRLIERHLEIGKRSAALREQIKAAKSAAATRGEFMPPAKFRALEKELTDLGQEALRVQSALGKIRDERKAKNIANNDSFERRFIVAAREFLDEETYAEIRDAALDTGEDDDS